MSTTDKPVDQVPDELEDYADTLGELAEIEGVMRDTNQGRRLPSTAPQPEKKP